MVFFFLPDLVKTPLVNFPPGASLLEAASWGLSTESVYKWHSLAAPFIKKCSATYLACRRGHLSNCMYLGPLWQAFQATMPAQEPPTQNTCLMPRVCVLHFSQLRKNQPPSVPVPIPQLGSKGVMSHILGATANFWSYYGVFAVARIFISSQSSMEQVPWVAAKIALTQKPCHVNFSYISLCVPVF